MVAGGTADAAVEPRNELRPVLRKKNTRISVVNIVTIIEVAVPTPVNTPAAIVVALDCTFLMMVATTLSTCSSSMFSGGPCSQSYTLLMPSVALPARSGTWSMIDGTMIARIPAITPRPTSIITTAAAAGGTR